MDADRRFQERPPQRHQQTQPRIFHDPRTTGIEILDDRLRFSFKSRTVILSEFAQVEMRDLMPACTNRPEDLLV
jgi:hypothetical protein